MNREIGYYWIRVSNGKHSNNSSYWTVAKWEDCSFNNTQDFDGCWDGGDIENDDVLEIDERRIIRQKGNRKESKLLISDISDDERIKLFIDELKTHKYFYGNEMGDVGNDIGHIIYKYLTIDDNIDVFIGGLLHGLSVADGSHI